MSSTRIRHGTLLVFTCVVTLCLSNASNAVPISIFNTGTNDSNGSWGSPNVSDIHYTGHRSPVVFTPVTVDDTMYPFPIWMANNYGTPWFPVDRTSGAQRERSGSSVYLSDNVQPTGQCDTQHGQHHRQLGDRRRRNRHPDQRRVDRSDTARLTTHLPRSQSAADS